MHNAEIYLKALALTGASIAFLFGIIQYRDTKQKEFYSALWNRRLELYQQASDNAAAIATTPNIASASEARKKFWVLFYGPMSLVEDQSVKTAMETFGTELRAIEIANGKCELLQQPAYRLTLAFRDSLKNTWNRPFEFEDLDTKKPR